MFMKVKVRALITMVVEAMVVVEPTRVVCGIGGASGAPPPRSARRAWANNLLPKKKVAGVTARILFGARSLFVEM